MHVLVDARRKFAFAGLGTLLGGAIPMLMTFCLIGSTESSAPSSGGDRVSAGQAIAPDVRDDAYLDSVAAVPVGSRHMLVSSFACSIPDCNYENAVLRYDAQTRAFSGVHIPNIEGPYGLAINPRTGRLLVVSRTRSEVTEHDPRTGDLLRTLIPSGSGGLRAPQGIVFSPQGTLLVTSIPIVGSQNSVNGILEFDPDTGQFLRVFINGGTINPLFPEDCGQPRCIRGANGLAYGPNGRLYVTSGVNNQVLEFNGTTGAYMNYFNANELVSPVGIAIRTGTLKNGYLVVTSSWDDPNQANDFQKVVEFNINSPGILSSAVILLSGVIDPGPLGFYNDGSVTCANVQASCLLVGERLSALSVFNNDRVQVRNGVNMALFPGPFTYPTPTDANLHVPTAMLGIAYDFASCDYDGNGSVTLRDLGWLQNCLTMTPPTAACLSAFDDDLTGSLSLRDRQVCLSRVSGVPYPCTNSNQCNDGNPCTTDVCSGGFCQFQVRPDGTTCADNFFCDGQEVCRGGVCSGVPPCLSAAYCDEANDRCRPCIVNAECNDNNVCTADVCDLNLGCVHTAISGPCENGNACTVNDFCSAGECQAGPPRNCNDNNVCTNDSCDPVDGCRYIHNLNPCNDGSVCTFNDFCLLGTCRGGESINCDDGNFCTINFCDPVLGCRTANRVGECDDQDPCTGEDTCLGGQCIGLGDGCDDDDPCTIDSCMDGECVHTPSDASCDDGLFCNGTESCDPVLGCVSSGNPCTGGPVCQNTCVEATQSCMSPLGTPCPSDGIPCTDDVCDGSGSCGVPNHNACDDGNACTVNSCNPSTGCQFNPVACGPSDGCCPPGCSSGSDPDCAAGPVCGNDICEIGGGEDCQNCSSDCNSVTSGPMENRYCCGDNVDCGDSRCTGNGNTCQP